MNDEKYAKSFELILHAGNAKFNYLSAIDEIKLGNIDKSNSLKEEGDKEIVLAHGIQSELLKKQLQDDENKLEVDMLSVHAQDHLTMATISKDLLEKYTDVYNQINCLKNEINEIKNKL